MLWVIRHIDLVVPSTLVILEKYRNDIVADNGLLNVGPSKFPDGVK
jgi:hypothetical protein